ncbi:hypothetical protein C8R47DRAFT_169955 [Mycena vitilis]|nr:hypothetical protein C8R47DRAFT_169955 [Mycena vitilis]
MDVDATTCVHARGRIMRSFVGALADARLKDEITLPADADHNPRGSSPPQCQCSARELLPFPQHPTPLQRWWRSSRYSGRRIGGTRFVRSFIGCLCRCCSAHHCVRDGSFSPFSPRCPHLRRGAGDAGGMCRDGSGGTCGVSCTAPRLLQRTLRRRTLPFSRRSLLQRGERAFWGRRWEWEWVGLNETSVQLHRLLQRTVRRRILSFSRRPPLRRGGAEPGAIRG